MNPVNFIANKINRQSKSRYNIACFATHESYQEALAKTNHTFYVLNPSNGKTWNSAYRKLPSNCILMSDFNEMPYDIDIILSQERASQLSLMNNFSNISRCPVINIDHTEPLGDTNLVENLKKIKSDFNVFITSHNKTSWANTDGIVIKHGIDTNIFKGWVPNKKKKVVYIVNLLKERDYACGWKEWNFIKDEVKKIDPNIEFTLIGNNPGISEPVNDPVKIADLLSNSSCYINTSKYSPLPMSLLEAMSVGMPIVSTRNQEVSTVLNKENSLSSNDIAELIKNVVDVCNNNQNYARFGASARRTILSDFSLETFIKNWNDLFDKAYNLRLGKKHEVFHIK